MTTHNKTITHILGYPRIGEKRELKFAQEQYWKGEIDQNALKAVGNELRQRHWNDQTASGLSYVTAGDFAWYDHVLTTSLLLGHVPARHLNGGFPDLDTLFKVARGQSANSEVSSCGCGSAHEESAGAAASDMTKWFNTNYHYIVPEFSQDDSFQVSWPQLFDEVNQAI